MKRSFCGFGRRYALGVVVACALPVGARAQAPEQPALVPSRDVTVTYRLTGGNGGQTAEKMSITYTKLGDRVRLDYYHWMESKTPYTTLVFDRPANRDIAIMEERRSYVERDAAGLANPGIYLDKSMQFTREGSASFAGTPCTEWSITAPGKPTIWRNLCITDDGVPLRLAEAPPGTRALTAIEVSYGSPAESVFDAPADFTRLKARTPPQR
jgi:hypothetical protein